MQIGCCLEYIGNGHIRGNFYDIQRIHTRMSSLDNIYVYNELRNWWKDFIF